MIILFELVKPCACFSQEQAGNYIINLKIGAPFATSKTTFRTYWFSVVDISLSGLKLTRQNLYMGLGLDYSRFKIGKWLDLESRLFVTNPNIIVEYNIHLSKRVKISPDFSFGYSWMTFTNPITPSTFIHQYNESGFCIKPGLGADFIFKNGISLGLAGSYKIIFKRFGDESINQYENRKESDYTSYWNLGIQCGFSF